MLPSASKQILKCTTELAKTVLAVIETDKNSIDTKGTFKCKIDISDTYILGSGIKVLANILHYNQYTQHVF